MHTVNTVTIAGNPSEIFEVASDVKNWPRILPHYRAVEVLPGNHSQQNVSMHCVRAFGPFSWHCRWKATQTILADEKRILFTHTAGPVKGMNVIWKLEPCDAGVRTTIEHEYGTQSWFSKVYGQIVGPLFVSNIANKTLMTIKQLIEQGETK